MNDCIECPLCDEVVRGKNEIEKLQAEQDAEQYRLKTNADVAFSCAKSLLWEVEQLKKTIDQQDEINDGLTAEVARQKEVIRRLQDALRKHPIFPDIEIEGLTEQNVALRAELANAKAAEERSRVAHTVCLDALVKIQTALEDLHKETVKRCNA